jgi:4'-phosphopantetheinyl transferase
MSSRVQARRQPRFGHPGLRTGEPHVIQASLLLPDHEIAGLLSTLSSDERERADRFYFAKDCRRFVACRGLLRSILGEYVGVPPADVKFSYGPHGKPSMDPEKHSEEIEFNVSRSDELALYAIALDTPIGVDVERVSSRVDVDRPPKNLFSNAQLKSYAGLAWSRRGQFLLRIWTRKEAFVKALGEGLAWPLDGFNVSAHARVQHLTVGGDRHAGEWTICHLDPAPPFVGALAVRGKVRAIHSFSYEDEVKGSGR